MLERLLTGIVKQSCFLFFPDGAMVAVVGWLDETELV